MEPLSEKLNIPFGTLGKNATIYIKSRSDAGVEVPRHDAVKHPLHLVLRA
jgi:hypothetical protein